ncbi:MAG TPA: methyltransferase, partial [Humisphaera sp.]|nr:methyltransferase [Humisphaera sp.]
FTELARSPLSFDQLREKFNLHPRGARDFLDALVALGMLNRTGDRYSNTQESNLFLDRNKPSYIGGILEMAGARLYGFWGNLTEALHTGSQQNESKGGGGSPFDALYSDPQRLKQFLASMTGLSMGSGQAIAGKFNWSKYKSFADVGCAQGGVAVQIALAQPHLQGTGYDLPAVQPIFEDYVKSFSLTPRVKYQAGDFMKDPLPEADVIIMGHILHDWDLAQKKMLIRKAYDAIPAGGAFIAFDAVIDDDRSRNAFGLLMSLNMLIETPGGFDYTGADCQGWMKEAGFRETRVEYLGGPDSMVVGIK